VTGWGGGERRARCGGRRRLRQDHNPASFYTSIRSAYATNAVPLGTTSAGELASDLAANRLRRYSFIAPNICNDEHSYGCDSATASMR
jgi:hypothetical protein